ncbi:MAG: hypothetical protein Q8L30_00410 [bacterium]|nr:hypothetical protein [bacterium]
MSKIITAVMLALAMALTNVANAAGPSGFSSLQPFRTFGKGEGEGVAYRYVHRTKADFVRLLRDSKFAKKEMRLTCQQLVRQIAEAHRLPFEGCEGAAAAIEKDADYTVVACTNDMFVRNNWLVVTNSSGTAFGAWHRACLQGEMVLAYKSQPILSLTCLNAAIPIAITPPPVRTVTAVPTPVPVPTGFCPKGIALNVDSWVLEQIAAKAPDLYKRVEEQMVAAARTDSEGASNPNAYRGDKFSRTLGDEVIQRVNVRAPLNGVSITAQLLDEKMNVVEDLGSFEFKDGIARIPLTEAQIGKIVQTIFPAWVSSPVVSGEARRLLFFPEEWTKARKDGTKPRGGYWCRMHEHTNYHEADKP